MDTGQEKSSIKVFVGMSGGVDSSVAAYLLKKEGFDVTGVFLRCYNLDGCSDADAEDARKVAGQIGIPFYVWDFEEEYKQKVVEYMIQGYKKGVTPNPDVMCNREIKFGIFLKRALKLGANFVATGHYVRKVDKDGRSYLFAAEDKNKDQSYFLWTLTQEDLRHCLFPIGDIPKPEVRRIAEEAGLSTASKKDSQGICFLGKISLEDFLRNYIPEKKGDIIDSKGEKVGEHRGAHFYTIGQRHLGVDLKKTSNSTLPYFVSGKDVENNLVMVSTEKEKENLYKEGVMLSDINFINPFEGGGVLARVRYRQPLFKAELKEEGDAWKLSFSEPQKFVASGQSAVLYLESGEMLGGGVIV